MAAVVIPISELRTVTFGEVKSHSGCVGASGFGKGPWVPHTEAVTLSCCCLPGSLQWANGEGGYGRESCPLTCPRENRLVRGQARSEVIQDTTGWTAPPPRPHSAAHQERGAARCSGASALMTSDKIQSGLRPTSPSPRPVAGLPGRGQPCRDSHTPNAAWNPLHQPGAPPKGVWALSRRR